MLLLFFVLFIPMQWGAPGGTVTLYQYVVEVIPNVSGEVIEVPVQPLVPLKQGDVLFRIDPTPFEDAIAEIEASLKLARVNLERARELFAKKLGPEVEVDRYAAEVGSYTARFDQAKWELDQTVVRAPANGYAAGVTLRPGQRVANLPLRSWMSFVNIDQGRLVIGIDQNRARHLRLGQSAEVTFKILPGRVFAARVLSALPLTPQGQLNPSGDIPFAPTAQTIPQPYGVILELTEDDPFMTMGLDPLAISRIPGGAIGTGAIYTESVKVTHIIRKVMLRMEAWLNYIKPY
jgi:multidrug efflux pump subunit AcrA (membrane-fusion protein)